MIDISKVDFGKTKGLVPVITQDFKTKEVLMLGFMNKEALEKTLKSGRVTYFSRAKRRLWTKGETSGNFQLAREIYLDCDNDTLLIKVEQSGNVCHTGNKTCFFKKMKYRKKQEKNGKNKKNKIGNSPRPLERADRKTF